MPSRRRALFVLAAVVGLALLSLFVALAAGSMAVSLGDVVRAISGSGGGVAGGGHDPVRGLLFGSVRRTDAGDGGDVRQPAVSQRRRDRLSTFDSLATPPPRRAGRGDLRQGPAGNDARLGVCRFFGVRDV